MSRVPDRSRRLGWGTHSRNVEKQELGGDHKLVKIQNVKEPRGKADLSLQTAQGGGEVHGQEGDLSRQKNLCKKAGEGTRKGKASSAEGVASYSHDGMFVKGGGDRRGGGHIKRKDRLNANSNWP